MGQIRSVTSDDMAGLAELLDGVFRRAASVHDQDVLSDFPLVFAPENYRNCRVIELDRGFISHAAIFPCEFVLRERRIKMAVIVMVATHPDHRRRGYAAQLMRDLQQMMHEEDYDLGILWTGVPDFYRKLDWEVFTPRGWFSDDLRSQGPLLDRLASACDPPAGIESFDETRHLAGVIELHEAEPVRTHRSRSEYAALLALPKIRVWISQRDSQVSAYVVIGQAVNKFGVIEYGGPADDVLFLIAHALRTQSLDRELPLLINHTRSDLAERFEEAGQPLHALESSRGRGCEMLYIVRPDDLPRESLEELFVWGLDYA